MISFLRRNRWLTRTLQGQKIKFARQVGKEFSLRDSSTAAAVMQLRIWGSRGSIPTPTRENLLHGGNTSCIEIRLPNDESFIFDSGTGICDLGRYIAKNPDTARSLNIFLTHFHWDHLQGLPFFLPLFDRDTTITFHSSRPVRDLRQILGGQMTAPYFPIDFESVASTLNFARVTEEAIGFDDVSISTFDLNHPGGASGYIIRRKGATVVYATDHEHGNVNADRRLVIAARDADVLLFDAHFTPEEYPFYIGRGHGTWLEATRVANEAGVKTLILFHHNPSHNDSAMQRIVEKACKRFPNTIAAAEGATLNVGREAR